MCVYVSDSWFTLCCGFHPCYRARVCRVVYRYTFTDTSFLYIVQNEPIFIRLHCHNGKWEGGVPSTVHGITVTGQCCGHHGGDRGWLYWLAAPARRLHHGFSWQARRLAWSGALADRFPAMHRHCTRDGHWPDRPSCIREIMLGEALSRSYGSASGQDTFEDLMRSPLGTHGFHKNRVVNFIITSSSS